MNKEVQDAISRNIKLLRKHSHLSQEEFCTLMNCSRTTYSGYECGYRLPDLVGLYDLALANNLEVGDFFLESPEAFLNVLSTKTNK